MKKNLLFYVFATCICANVYANNFFDLFNKSLSAAPAVNYDNDMSISNIDKRNFNVNNCDLRLNEQFYITREFNEGMVIVAKASVLSKQDDICNAKLLDEYDLEQKSMPSLKQNLKSTDKILKDINYKKALTIAPNSALYEEMFDHEYMYIHPDVFVGFLAYSNTKKPKVKDFKKFCFLNDIGTLNIVLKDRAYMLDCESFQILNSFDIANSNFDEKQNSIYANVFYKLKIKYNEYFLNLIKENNKEYFKKDK